MFANLTYVSPGLSLIFLLLLAGLILVWRDRPILGRRLLAISLFLLLVWSWPPAATLFVSTLERWYPVRQDPPKDVQAMVVLSATFYAPDPPRPGTVPGFALYVRCRCAAALYQQGWRVPVLVSGGGTGERNMAVLMRDTLIKEGVPAERIWLEGASRSTYENAVFSARLLQPRGLRRILLVTEALHMLRSERTFRAAGFDVVPAPCAFRSAEFEGKPSEWLLGSRAVNTNEQVLHEWVGLLAYRASGRLR